MKLSSIKTSALALAIVAVMGAPAMAATGTSAAAPSTVQTGAKVTTNSDAGVASPAVAQNNEGRAESMPASGGVMANADGEVKTPDGTSQPQLQVKGDNHVGKKIEHKADVKADIKK